MPATLDPLPDLSVLDVNALRDLVLSQHERLRSRETEIENLKLLVMKLKRMQFGRKSEKLDRQIEQLELSLEDLESTPCTAPTTRRGVADSGARAGRGSSRLPVTGGPLRPAVLVVAAHAAAAL